MKQLDLPKPFLILAPMYDVTDTVFRRIIADMAAPDLFFTEFVNVDGLQSAGRQKIIHRLKYSDEERPIIAQIWGKQPDNYRQTAKELVDMGFDGIDINMGCPDKAVLKNGCCGALIKDHELAGEIIEQTRRGAGDKIPISVKTRIGFRELNKDWLKFLLGQNLSMLSIHLRTVREMSKVPAHWELMSQIREMRDQLSPDTLLVANGDVQTRQQAEELAKKHKIDGVMIGRGVFSDPYVFAKKSPWDDMPAKDKIALYQKHVEQFAKTWENNERPIVTLNKFCKIYINGFEGAKELREDLMHAKDAADLLSKLKAIRG
jgi:tRNA-dihydrouridine synthase